jgi:hypothetical protein
MCIDDRNLVPKQQKGCCRGSKGCKYQLLISKAIFQEYKSRKKNVFMAQINYHMSYWKTSMCLHTEGKLIETEDLETQRGIFQGDTLSPLPFCSSLMPLTEQLNN